MVEDFIGHILYFEFRVKTNDYKNFSQPIPEPSMVPIIASTATANCPLMFDELSNSDARKLYYSKNIQMDIHLHIQVQYRAHFHIQYRLQHALLGPHFQVPQKERNCLKNFPSKLIYSILYTTIMK